MEFSCLDCTKKFSQFILIITNGFVALIGLSVMIIGIWASVDTDNHTSITEDDDNYTGVAVLLIVVGLFVLAVGIGGIVGAIFASTICGRIILGIYAVFLTILVIIQISGGIAAAVKKGEIESVLKSSANETFLAYFNRTMVDWDKFQQDFHCCGVVQPSDYSHINRTTVPESCCKDKQNCNNKNYDSPQIYSNGCVNVIIDALKNNLGAIAAGAILLGLIQITGIVMACFVTLYKRENKYEVV